MSGKRKGWQVRGLSDHYLAGLAKAENARSFRISLLGLSEVSPASGHQIALAKLGIRLSIPQTKTCLTCLDLHSPEIAEEQILIWLSSSSPVISRACFTAVCAQRRSLSSEALATLIANPTLSDQARGQAAQLLRFSPRWQTLSCLFLLANRSDQMTRDLATKGLHDWLGNFSNSYTLPTPRESKLIAQHFSKCRPRLDSFLSKQYDHLLTHLSL